ncbi:acetate--CoA ligase family protein [Candidatus Dojkabacteria bacterium]|nr:acetate--CoA ligase family protein [Candidatus Dojkabacteria bacterium]
MPSLDSLIKPKSVAVIGASRDRSKLGRLVLDNIVNQKYRGKIFPVNPKANVVGSLRCYKSIKAIPGKVDLAIIAIPAQFVLPVVRECCEKKVCSIAIISAGFSETGHEGLVEEYKIKELVEKYGVNLLGPNCLGIISSEVNLNATFAKNKMNKGSIAFLSQSGALGTAALDWAEGTGVGFSHFVSLGNKANLSENDFLEYFSRDKDVKALAYYLEDFSDGRRFMQLAAKAGKPIVVLKPGKSEAAQKALGSHTGSLAQDDMIVSSALTQARVLRVRSIEELFNVIRLLSAEKKLKGNNIAIVTNAGGPGVFTTDAIEGADLNLATLSNSVQKRLALKLPAAANVKNPVDVLGDALADRFRVALELVEKDESVDGVIVILTPQVMTEIGKTAEIITAIAKKSRKFVIPVFMGGEEVIGGRKIFDKNLVTYFNYPEDAVRALSYLYKARRKLVGKRFKVKVSEAKAKRLMKGIGGPMDTQLAERILKLYKIPLLESHFPQDIAAARRYASKLEYPVVMKLIHPELLHKTDVNAVRLNIEDDKQLDAAFNELKNLGIKLELAGARIQMQHFVKGALELIVGVRRDKDQYVDIKGEQLIRKMGFGHCIVFGMGGIYTEVYKDIALGIAPLSISQINDLISKTKVSQILEGARGKKYNKDKVIEVIASLSQLVTDFPQFAEIDINPLFAKGRGVWVVDVKMIVW